LKPQLRRLATVYGKNATHGMMHRLAMTASPTLRCRSCHASATPTQNLPKTFPSCGL